MRWEAALDDAELDAGDCRLMCLTTAPDGPTSAHYPPGGVLVADQLPGADAAAEPNERANIDKHRIVVVRDAPAGHLGRALFAAKLRHELEHAGMEHHRRDGAAAELHR